MNSRRFKGAPPQALSAHYHTVAQERRCASQSALMSQMGQPQP